MQAQQICEIRKQQELKTRKFLPLSRFVKKYRVEAGGEEGVYKI
jgi:nicotinate-nucleotide pyrophosphorylase